MGIAAAGFRAVFPRRETTSSATMAIATQKIFLGMTEAPCAARSLSTSTSTAMNCAGNPTLDKSAEGNAKPEVSHCQSFEPGHNGRVSMIAGLVKCFESVSHLCHERRHPIQRKGA
jgi:hypothetical protein